METEYLHKKGPHNVQIPDNGESAQISIAQADHIIVGNNSKIVVSCKSKSSFTSKRKSSHEKKKISCKYPLTTSIQPLTVDQKLDIKDRIGWQWKDLGRRLGLTDAELEQLDMEHRDRSEVIYQIVHRWEQRMADRATCEALAKVFIKLGRGDLADLLSDSSESTMPKFVDEST